MRLTEAWANHWLSGSNVDSRAERTDLRQATTGIAIAYRENVLADEIDGILAVAEADLASGVERKSDSPAWFRMARGRRITGHPHDHL